MSSLSIRLQGAIEAVLRRGPRVWLVWCDPRRDWLPLLQRAAEPGGFMLLRIDEYTHGELGGPVSRQRLQEQIDRGQPFVLWVPVPADRLGWLWSQALLAERIYDRSLRQQLRDWGWRPDRLTITDDELAALARRNMERNPAEWGGGGLEPDLALLLGVLAGGATPEADQRPVLDLTIERAGLPLLTESDLPGWRKAALARLLVTQAHAVAPALVNEQHELLIAAPCRGLALALVERWLDSLRLSRALPDAILAADRITGLQPPTLTPGPDHGPFLSRAAEGATFAAACLQLSRQDGRGLLEMLGRLEPHLARHAVGFWGDGCAHAAALPWGELLRLSRAAGEALAAGPTREWANPAEAVTWYTSGGWRLDHAGEEILRNLPRTTPELLTLITPLRAAFRARWEDTLLRWSALWVAAGCPNLSLPTAGEWLAGQLEGGAPTAIIMADALRYDLGASLAKLVNEDEGTERAVVQATRAPLPSVTALGMAAALPITERELTADVVGGKWAVRAQGRAENLALAADRRAWWQARGGVAADSLLTLQELQGRELPAPAHGRTRLVIYDASIDALGHDDELEAQGSGLPLSRYAELIRRLHAVGWSRILVTTDHGYIHWPGSQETNVAPPAVDPAYSSRRALAYPARVAFSGPQALAPGGGWRVALPSGAACFRTYGGLGFFHGGASLQEWVIPCVTIEWPAQAQPVSVEIEPLPNVLSQRPRVTVIVRRASLFVEDATARQVDVVIRHAASRALLFRSSVLNITPDQERVTVALTLVAQESAPRGTPLLVEVRDRRSDEAPVLYAIESVLAIELQPW